MKKLLRYFLPIAVLVTCWSMYPKVLIYWKYKLFDPNEKVKFKEVDQDSIRAYKDILTLPDFTGKPSIIFTNTRFDYGLLEGELPFISDLKRNIDESRVNIIYTAIGLEDESDNKMEWFMKMKEYNLEGTHISLSDEFKDYSNMIKVTKQSESEEVWDIPKYLILDTNGSKIDTIYTYLQKSPEVKRQIISKLEALL